MESNSNKGDAPETNKPQMKFFFMRTTRHKWDGGIISKVVDGGLQYCVKCGYIKQYVKGIPTYFRNDTVYDRYAPKCDNRELKKNESNSSP